MGLSALLSTVRSTVHRPRIMRGPRTERPFDTPVLTTPRLVLRPYRMGDAEDWYRIQTSEEVLRFLPWPERDRERSRQHLRHRTHHTRLRQRDDFLALAIQHDGHVIGDVSVHLRQVAPSRRGVEIGWVLHPLWWGRGYATEAANAMLDFCFETIGAQWVLACIHPENSASLALSARLGMVQIATIDDEIRTVVTPTLRAAHHERALLRRDAA